LEDNIKIDCGDIEWWIMAQMSSNRFWYWWC